MRNNEFNNVEITNEKQIRGLEFGKTQESETVSQKENKLPEGELNEKYVGKTIRKQTEVNVQYANKATAPAHGSTTVTSATTATSVAATSASVVTAASVVAVTAISVAAGISVALHDYEYKFESFLVTSNSLSYELYIVDHKNERPDGEPYEEYDNSQEEEPIQEEPVSEDVNVNVYAALNSMSFVFCSSSRTCRQAAPLSVRPCSIAKPRHGIARGFSGQPSSASAGHG